MLLSSGLLIERATERLRAFCQEEYLYYDAIESADPNHIDPADILVTVAVNSFVNSADRVRAVHRGLAERCDPILEAIPVDADLGQPGTDLDPLEQLLAAACGVKWVLVAVATKVLHRKRRQLIPMLDSVLIDYYRSTGVDVSWAALEDGARAGSAAMPIVRSFKGDLQNAGAELEALRAELREEGFDLTNVRILELLIWIQTEPRGYYRL